MHRLQQDRQQTLHQAQSFLDAHAVVGVLKDSEGRKQLDHAVDQLAAQVAQQAVANDVLANGAAIQAAAAAELKQQHMGPIAKFARARLRGAPDFTALARSTASLSGLPLVRAARAMATALAPHTQALTAGGLPANAVEELAAAANAVEAAITARRTARSNRVIATAGVKHELKQGREAVAMLDAVATKLLAGQPELVAGWRQAKRVTRQSRALVLDSASIASPPVSAVQSAAPAGAPDQRAA